MAAVHGHHSPTPIGGGFLRPTSPSDHSKTHQDRKDLERFSKFFILKAVQVIVQSRLGEKMKFPSRASSSGADWFNLAIEDNPEIMKQTKLAIGSNSLPNPPLIVEISLKTIDSKKLTLEIWKLSFNDETEDNVRILYTVYNRMSLLLKSIITVTRVLPAYKLSRVKGDYVMEYNVYTMDSNNEDAEYCSKLGRECRKSLLGSVVTPFGSIAIEFAYRTKMEMSFEQSPVVVKEDHYSMDATLQNSQTDLASGTPQSHPNPVKIPAFSDPLPPTPNNSANSTASETSFNEDIPFSNLLKKSLLNSSKFSPGGVPNKRLSETATTSTESDSNNSCRTIPEIDSPKQQQHQPQLVSANTNTGSGGSQEFEFLEVKPLPFAPETSDTSSDPASFFTSLQNPPVLQSLESATTTNEINKQLTTFEENLPIFDDFVKKLCS